MLKTVYFDLGNVLFFFSLAKMFEQLAHCAGLPLEDVKAFLLEERIQEQYEMGKLGTEKVWRLFQKRAPRPCSFAEFVQAASDIFTPNQELWPTVEALKKAGLRLILLSNTSECHFQYLSSNYPILDLFDHKVLSYKVGVLKPDAEIFREALSHSQCRPEECFYTDDIARFIDSAKGVGLDGEVFTNVPALHCHLVQRGCSFLLEKEFNIKNLF